VLTKAGNKLLVDISEDEYESGSDDGIQRDCHKGFAGLSVGVLEQLPVPKPIYASAAHACENSAVV